MSAVGCRCRGGRQKSGASLLGVLALLCLAGVILYILRDRVFHRNGPEQYVPLPEVVIDTNSVEYLEQVAETADAQAQFDLGCRFAEARGVPEDFGSAAKWFRRAAELNHADAQYNLGVVCFEGMGVTQDYAAAMHWYTKAAEQGHGAAQYSLGCLYAKGIGANTNYARAHELFRQAAEQGLPLAQFNLGVLLYNGQGTETNYAEAAKWLNMAATSGVSSAQIALGEMYFRGQGVLKNRDRALRFFRSALEEGVYDVLDVYSALLREDLRPRFDEKFPAFKPGRECAVRSVTGRVLSGACVSNHNGAIAIETAAAPQWIKLAALDLDSRIRADAAFRDSFFAAVVEQQVFALTFLTAEASTNAPPVSGPAFGGDAPLANSSSLHRMS